MLALPQLDSSSEEPIYRQLYAHFQRAILSGRLARGERVPPTRELAGLLGLNRATVAMAYELLESEGLIRGHVGRGSFVEGPGLARETGLQWEELMPARRPSEAFLPGEAEISFTSARPSEELFPMAEFRATVAEVVAASDAAHILQLGSPFGYGPLRRYLLDAARERKEARDGDDLVIANGCQQALDLLQRVFTSPGDTVLLEDPVYPGLKNVFHQAGVRIAGIPPGFDAAQLERLLAVERPRLLIVTPNFQNPTGHTMPLDARRELLRAAREARVPVVENDIYGDLRYHGESLPSLKHLDETGDVIYLKSFSKIAFPGLRVGWVIGPRPVLARMAEAKQCSDLHSDQLSQAVLLRFAESGRLAAHKRRMLAVGAERLRAVLAACEKHLPECTRFTRPQGGMNLWVRLPEPLDAAELLPRALRESVSYLPGRAFAVSRYEPGSLRLSFAGLPPEKIEAGVAILGEVAKKELERARAARRGDLAPAIV